MKAAPSYGTTRARGANVSYGQIESAAMALLSVGVRPTVDGIREALKTGSQRTLLSGLQRFWKELGERLSGVPDSRRRLPASVADLADTLWQNALQLATEAVLDGDSAVTKELAQLRTDMEKRAHSLAQREIEIDSLIRSRERTMKELEEHLRSAMALVNKRDATIRSLESRLAAALTETEAYRQRIASVIARTRKQDRTTAGSARPARSPTPAARRARQKKVPRPPPRGSSVRKRRSKQPPTIPRLKTPARRQG